MAEENEQEQPKIKSEYEKQMDKVIYSIEAAIGGHLQNGHTPTVLLGHARSIDQIIEHFTRGTFFVRALGEGVTMSFGDGEVPLMVYRTMDMQSQEIKVL